MTIQRRDFIALAAASTAFPLVARAQAKVPRVAIVDGAGGAVAEMTTTSKVSTWPAFFQELARLGFAEGQTIVFERYSSPSGDAQRNAPILVGSAPDLIFLAAGATTTLAVMALTKSIPIVMTSGDPMGQGIVTNLAHPGGNVAAVATAAGPESEAKVLELLSEAVPTARRVAYVGVGVAGQFGSAQLGYVRAATDAAPRLGLSMTTVVARDPADEQSFRDAMAMATTSKSEMIQFGRHSQIQSGSPTIAKLALDARLPAISPFGEFTEAGGLLSYGSNSQDNMRKAAGYVALVLNGAKPGDLPVLLPTLFDFVINLRTAKAIGLTVPPSLLIQAPQVIE